MKYWKYVILEFRINNVATTSSGTERTCCRVRRNAVENAKRASEGARNGPQIAKRSAGECGTKRGPRRTNSDSRETLPQCSTGVH